MGTEEYAAFSLCWDFHVRHRVRGQTAKREEQKVDKVIGELYAV